MSLSAFAVAMEDEAGPAPGAERSIIVSGGHDGDELMTRTERVCENTLATITADLESQGFLPPGRHFSISVVSETGTKTEIRKGSELVTVAAESEGALLLTFERWDLEERHAEWIRHLKNWCDTDGARVDAGLKELARAGVPHKLRRDVYSWLAGVHQAKAREPGLFASLVSEFEQSCEPKVLSDIDKDLHRTLTTHPAFERSAAATKAMRRVLAAYSLYRPQVGYCQGMSFVVALLLFITRQYPTEPHSTHQVAWEQNDDPEAEEDTFWILHHFVEKVLPPAYFGSAPGLPQLLGLQRALLVINRLVQARQPVLAAHMERIGMPVSCIVVRWLPCLFAGTMPVESVLRVWDMAMVDGMVAVYRAAIAVLEMQQAHLLQTDDPAQVAAATNSAMEQLQDAGPLVYWMHTSWPWLASWVYPPDISPEDTHDLWSEIREAEQQETAAEMADLEPSAGDMSFLEMSWGGGAAVFGDDVQLVTEGSWCVVHRAGSPTLRSPDLESGAASPAAPI